MFSSEQTARSQRRREGFTLLEAVTTLAVLSLIAGLVLPAVQNQMVRVRTMTSAKQVAAAIQRTRLEAIRRNQVGELGLGDRRVEAEVDGITFMGLLADGVDFGAPLGEKIVDGFGDSDRATFTVAGGVRESGAFRLAGPKDTYVEVRIDPPATARVQIRKWDGEAWRAQGEGGVSWTW